jgi:hypothetical protein
LFTQSRNAPQSGSTLHAALRSAVHAPDASRPFTHELHVAFAAAGGVAHAVELHCVLQLPALQMHAVAASSNVFEPAA